MKRFRLIGLLLALMTSLCAYSITFMGASLGSDPTTFSNILKNKGCKYVSKNYGSSGYTETYKGDFWQFSNATININVSGGRVVSVGVRYDYASRASQLVNELDKKYGKHSGRDNYDPILGYMGQTCYWYLSDGSITVTWDSQLGIFIDYSIDNPNRDL